MDQPGATTPMLSATVNGSSGGQSNTNTKGSGSTKPSGGQRTIADELSRVRGNYTKAAAAKVANSSNRRKLLLFDRASSRWWNPQFASSLLESQYWKCSFPQLRDRFRSGLIFIVLKSLAWLIYHALITSTETYKWNTFPYQLASLVIIVISLAILGFTYTAQLYQRFYLPTSFLCTFLICVVSLLLFSLQNQPVIGPVGMFTTSVEVVLLLYTVIPLPLYLCILAGVAYSVLYEVLSHQIGVVETPALKLILHVCIHLLGVHIFILSQVRQRKTFIKVGQSLLARKDIEVETQFKDHMIMSVMPRTVADDLMKGDEQTRRPSMNPNTDRSVNSGGKGGGTLRAGGGVGDSSVPAFRPFTMNLMQDVSILFADIAGFTKMSSNKTADELVSLLNDLFGRFDTLCGLSGCEKISTLGDCYYCVSGCPQKNKDHAKCCVEMGLNMIKAIKEFDEDRNQDVNMRVGIHTGTVMCGMVGTKRFKFDVFSNDVTLANTMESSGMAGRVHVSETTAAELTESYDMEYHTVVEGLKSYFITGRKGEIPLEDQLKSEGHRNVLDDLEHTVRHVDSSTIEEDDLGPPTFSSEKDKKLSKTTRSVQSLAKGGGGSLRMKLLGGRTSSQPIQPGESDPKKSSSLQTLSATPGQPPSSASNPLQNPRAQTVSAGSWNAGGGTGTGSAGLNKELANGDSGSCRSGASGEHRGLSGSRSSGLAEMSEAASRALMDSVITAHATSLTRFETDYRDFDKRLADCIQSSNLARGGYWIHGSSLNPWTLQFRDADVQNAYRKHFINHDGDDGGNVYPTGEDSDNGNGAGRRGSNLDAPKYSVLVDILVATTLFLIISALAFGVYKSSSIAWLVYFILAFLTIFIVVVVSVYPMWKHRNLIGCLTAWVPRHLVGLLLLALPIGAAFTNVPNFSDDLDKAEVIRKQLMVAYIVFTVIFGHCNFSQISSWPKTFQATLLGSVLIFLAQGCVTARHYCSVNTLMLDTFCAATTPPPLVTPPLAANSSSTPSPSVLLESATFKSSVLSMSSSSYPCIRNDSLDNSSEYNTRAFNNPLFSGHDLYRYEIILDLLLALLLIGFLNYQFEWNFRMSFYGDYQAKNDTAKMQGTRDQADWLLSNIIPNHVVEELKVNSKYSESNAQVAVVFASIINWDEMYEETFEGGKEFLRVLNEVIGDFDELLDRPEHKQVEKIKTIGSTYMAASGLNPEKRRGATSDKEHLYQLMEFSLNLQEALENFNADLLNFEFKMKIGFNIGPITAGVIGTTKLYYDIWGDTVNIASRMYSTGKEGCIQVPKKVATMLGDSYNFEFRDHVEVKGIDGGMDVYLVAGRKGPESGLGPAGNNQEGDGEKDDAAAAKDVF